MSVFDSKAVFCRRILRTLIFLLAFITAFMLLPCGVTPVRADTVTTTLPTGYWNYPSAVAVNPVTNKIYVANNGSGNVMVIDGATNKTTTIGNVDYRSYPSAVAVNPVTNKIYVTNSGRNNVTVIDGATNSTTTVAVGKWPEALAVNQVTNEIYVVNKSSGDVTVIDGNNNSTTSVTVGSVPTAVSVNPVTNKIYVVNSNSNNVTVIDGVTHSTTLVEVGLNPTAVTVNLATNKIYIANENGSSVTVIDGETNSTTPVAVGSNPTAVAVNPATNKIYIANESSSNVTVLDGETNSTITVAAGKYPSAVAVNLTTNKIYVTNRGSNNVTVINGETNVTTTVPAGDAPYGIAVNQITNKIYVINYIGYSVTVIDGANSVTTTVPAGKIPGAVAVNPATNKIYIANKDSNNVTVINGSDSSTITVAVGGHPSAVAVNPTTNKIYTVNEYSGNVTVIDGVTNSTTTVDDVVWPKAVAVNPVTNKIYVTDYRLDKVTVIDGSDNSTVTVAVGKYPGAVAVNPVTNKIYVANWGSNSVTVIDGATNSTTTVAAGVGPKAVAVNTAINKIYIANHDSNNVTVIDGATNSTYTVAVGKNPSTLAVSPTTNKIYVANKNGSSVTVIDGYCYSTITVAVGGYPGAVAVNPVTNKVYVANENGDSITMIDDITGKTTTLIVGINPSAVAVNPATNKVYVVNSDIYNFYGNGSVTAITEQAVHSDTITTAITPIKSNAISDTTPTFQLSAVSHYSTTGSAVQQIWCQVDSISGQWSKIESLGNSGSYTSTALTTGTHILYAFASDGQAEGLSSSPVIGSISSYAFTVVPELSISTAALPDGTTGEAYSSSMSANGGASPYTWSASGLPAGLSINTATGVVSGTPAVHGTYNIQLSLEDSTGTSISKNLSLKINPSELVIVTANLPYGIIDTAYSSGVSASGGVPPYTWSASGLPTGLDINTVTGAVYGTPTVYGNYNILLTLKDSNASSINKSVNLKINPPELVISTDSLPEGMTGVDYSTGVKASGGIAPYTWSATGLPVGFEINSVTGAVYGTPTMPGTYNIQFTVKDSINSSVLKSIAVVVAHTNEAPAVNVPADITVTEDTAGAITGVSFYDADAGSGAVTVRFTVPRGILAASSGGWVTVAGSGSGTLTLSGSVADINAFVSAGSVTFTTSPDCTDNVLLCVDINDNGNTGAGGSKTGNASTTILVNAVNDAPVITISDVKANVIYNNTKLISISGNVIDAEKQTVQVSAAIGGKTSTASVDTASANTWTLMWDIGGLGIQDGTYTGISISAVDTSGGTGAATYTGNIIVDSTPPEVVFGTNGSEISVITAQTMVTVADSGSGVIEGALKYAWTTSTAEPAWDDWVLFSSGDTLTNVGGDGEWYLHIQAKDVAGNTANVVSKLFTADNNAIPTAQLISPPPGYTDLQIFARYIYLSFGENVTSVANRKVTITDSYNVTYTYTIGANDGNFSGDGALIPLESFINGDMRLTLFHGTTYTVAIEAGAVRDAWGNENAAGELGSFSTTSNIQSGTVIVVPVPAQGGSVSGNGVYKIGGPVTVTATPNDGYKFVNWSGVVGDSQDASYTFTFPQDYPAIRMTAFFEELPSYTVTFKDWNGTELKTETVYEGSGATAPPSSPTRTYYSFTGWDKDFSKVTSDLTVTAQYSLSQLSMVMTEDTGVAGDTINFSGKTLSSTSVTLKVVKADGTEVSLQNLTSDTNGDFSGSFKVPDGMTAGLLYGSAEAAGIKVYSNVTIHEATQTYVAPVEIKELEVEVKSDGTNKNLELPATASSADAAKTISIPFSVTDATISVANQVYAPVNGVLTTKPLPAMNIEAVTSLSANPVKVEIPASVTISAPASSNWAGTINVPTVKANDTVAVSADSGKTVTVNTVIEVGSEDVKLTFNKAVRLLIPGMAGKDAGYTRNGVFTKITRVLSADSQSTADSEIPDEGDARIDAGNDMIIWTKHFTSFIAYTQTTTSSNTSDSSSDCESNEGSSTGGSLDTKPVQPAQPVQPVQPPVNLNDISGHWAADNIKKLVATEAIEGYPDGSFKPDDSITRAEFVKILVTALKIETKTGKVFTDTADHWAKDYIATANANGIVSGYSDNVFGPDDFITREQMAVMIDKALKLADIKADTTFTDKKDISDWANGGVSAAKAKGLLEGYPDGSFRPQDEATRAEAVTVIIKALELK